MMKTPTLSIIIPTLNEAEEIKHCVESFLDQIGDGDEVIVVDNGSTDGTVDKVKNMENKKLKLLKEPQEGVGYARRLGFEAASGEVLIRIDADSRARQGWLDHIRELFKDEGIYAWSGYVGFREADGDDITVKVFNWGTFFVNRLISGHNNLFGSNMALRKRAWETAKANVRDNMRYWEDLEIAEELAAFGINPRISRQILMDISYRGGLTSLASFHRRMLNGIRTYWKRSKLTAVIAAPWAYMALAVIAGWRLSLKLFGR